MKDLALLVRRAQRRLLVARMRASDFLPASELGCRIDALNARIAILILTDPWTD